MVPGPALDSEFVVRRTADFTLRDGVRIRIRPVVPDDKAALAQGFERLSPESRYRRFMGAVDRLTPRMLAYLTEIDYVGHFALIAFAPAEPGAPGLGVARYVRLAEDPATAEAAVAVVDEYQGRGIGTLLLDLLGAVALEHGVRRFRYYVLAENRPMVDMLRHLGAHPKVDSPGVLRGDVELPERLEELKGTDLYRTLRAAARGELPVLGRPAPEPGPVSPPAAPPEARS